MTNILIAGAATLKGKKIAKFLDNKGLTVFGLDRYSVEPKNGFSRTFRIDLRHKDSIRLAMGVAKPDAIIYCMEKPREDPFSAIDIHYSSYLSLLIAIQEQKIPKLVLSLAMKGTDPVATPFDVTQMALVQLTKIFNTQYMFEFLLLPDELNLLKEVKKFLITHDEEVKEAL